MLKLWANYRAGRRSCDNANNANNSGNNNNNSSGKTSTRSGARSLNLLILSWTSKLNRRFSRVRVRRCGGDFKSHARRYQLPLLCEFFRNDRRFGGTYGLI
ncbi:hypothetical protein TKK_0016908 [Trichogramma kaykai]